MRITKKKAHEMLSVLDEIKKDISEESKKSSKGYPYTEWERKREHVKERLEKLPEYIEKAASMITVQKKRGPDKELDLTERTTLLLFAKLMRKSNRDMEDMLILLSPLFSKPVSYKTIERLYSDEDVRMVLHNLFVLLLDDEGVSGNMSGDGTGYTLTVSKHYASSPKKKSKDYRYAFRLMDIDTGMYVGVGYSSVSEMRAFHDAMEMAKRTEIRIDTLRLDRYYSSRKILKLFGEEVSVFVIPKKNIATIGIEWSRVIKRIIMDPVSYLKDYFMRNLSETGYSSDKGRFGGIIRQKREERQSMAMLAIGFLHNMFFARVHI